MQRNPSLEAAIVADPDHEPAFLVYGDWLLERGDPRGELSTLDRALAGDPWGDRGAELRARRTSLFRAHRDTLLGPLAPHVDARRLALTWAHGFVREARVGWRGRAEGLAHDPVDVLRALLAHPSARLVHTLILGPTPLGGSLAPWIEALAEAPPPALRRLTIGVGSGRAPFFAEVGPLRAVGEAIPNLHELVVRGTGVSVAGLVLPALRRLELGALDLSTLDLGRFGALHALSVWGDVDLDWLGTARNPLALGLHGDPAANETVARLLATPVEARLTALDLAMSGLTQGRALLAAAERLRHVPVDVSLNRLSADTCRRLQAALPAIVAGGQARRTADAGFLDRAADRLGELLRAGEAASADRDIDGALAAAGLALRVAVWIGDLRGEARARATIAWAEQERGDSAAAVAHATARVERERDHAGRETGAAVDAAILHLAQLHRARGDLRHAETLLDATGSPQALTERAYAVLVQGRAAEALALVDLAIDRAGGNVTSNDHNVRGAVLQTLHRYDEADQAYAVAEQLAANDVQRIPIALNRAGLSYLLGRAEEARARTSAVIDDARARGDAHWETHALQQRGHWALNGGRPAEAVADLLAALTGFERLNDRANQGVACQLLGETYRRLLDFDQAASYAERALGLLRASGLREYEASTLNLLGGLAADRGDGPGAIAQYEAALQVAREIAQPRAESWHLTSLALAHLESGDAVRAADELRQAHAISRANGNRRWQGVCRVGLGRVHYALGAYDDAIAEYDAALALYAEVGEPTAAAQTVRGLALACAGRADEAAAALDDAAATVGEDEVVVRELAAVRAVLAGAAPMSEPPGGGHGIGRFWAWIHRGAAHRR